MIVSHLDTGSCLPDVTLSAEIVMQGKLEPVLANGGQTLKAMSLSFILDLQDAWRRHGVQALDKVAKNNPATLVAGMLGMAKLVDWDTAADATDFDRSMTPEQIMDVLEKRVKGRRLFEDFLRK